MFATTHHLNVNHRDPLLDGFTLVDIDASLEVALGDAIDNEFANAHPWGSSALVFSHSAAAGMALCIAEGPSYMIITTTGNTFSNENFLLRDGARVAAKYYGHDVFVRKRA